MAGKREAADFRGAGIENVQQDAFALLDAQRLTVPEHASIDGEGAIADFIAVWHSFRERGFHRGFAGGFEVVIGSGGRKEVLSHVAATAERRLEFLEREEKFAVEAAGLMARLDIERARESAVESRGEIGAGADVRVIEAEAGRIRRERNASHAARGDEGSSLFSGAIHFGGNAK